MYKIKFKHKGKVYNGAVEVEDRTRQLNIEDGSYKTLPVRIENTVYVVSKEMVIEIIDTDKLSFEEKKKNTEKEFIKEKCKQINYKLFEMGVSNFKNKTIEKALENCVYLIPLAKKLRNEGRLKLRQNK